MEAASSAKKEREEKIYSQAFVLVFKSKLGFYDLVTKCTRSEHFGVHGTILNLQCTLTSQSLATIAFLVFGENAYRVCC